MEVMEVLKERNALLFWFGWLNAATAGVLILLSLFKPMEFGGTNAWHKPLKFALSTTILCWSVAWYTGYLPTTKGIAVSSWIIVITLAFEVVYITWQAARGQASHFNVSTSFYSAMYSLMALAASLATVAVGYIGWHFFTNDFTTLPNYYLWAIRLGFLLFVVFSFQGFVMGNRMTHTIGGADGSPGIPFLNWSLSYGDLRVAHFIGMHALQALPLLAWYVLRNMSLTWSVSLLYALLAVFVWVQALRGNALLAALK